MKDINKKAKLTKSISVESPFKNIGVAFRLKSIYGKNPFKNLGIKPTTFSLANNSLRFTSSPTIKLADSFKLNAIQKIAKGANSITLASSSYNFVKKGSLVDKINKMKLRYNPKWDLWYMSEDLKHTGDALRKSISKINDKS